MARRTRDRTRRARPRSRWHARPWNASDDWPDSHEWRDGRGEGGRSRARREGPAQERRRRRVGATRSAKPIPHRERPRFSLRYFSRSRARVPSACRRATRAASASRFGSSSTTAPRGYAEGGIGRDVHALRFRRHARPRESGERLKPRVGVRELVRPPSSRPSLAETWRSTCSSSRWL